MVSVESLATFHEFKLYPYIINNKLRIGEQFVINNNKHGEEKQASLKLRLVVTMPTAFFSSCTDMRRNLNHFVLVFFNSVNSREHVDT
jgi:hypothetical protein